MFKLRVLLLAALVAAVAAFIPPIPSKAVRVKPVFAANPTANLLTQADKCLGGECNIDDVNELLVQLRVQITDLKEQTMALQNLEAELSGKNTGSSVDQVKSLIKAVLRALDVDPDDDEFPQIVKAAGFSGEPFRGGKLDENFPKWQAKA